MKNTDEISVERVTLCKDGSYRWVYEFPMMTNPSILITVMKVLLFSISIPAVIVFISDMKRDGLVKAFIDTLRVYLMVAAILIVLGIISYIILAAIYGWKYIVVFEMDEKGICHCQQKRQFKKAQVMGIVLAMAGGASRHPGKVGMGLQAATHSSICSDFATVKSVKGNKRRSLIKVNSTFAKNQIYLCKEDYDFVWEYITSRCPKAKIS